MSMQFEVKYSVSAPASVLAAVYNVSSEEVVVVGAGFCGVSKGKMFHIICNAGV